MIAESLPLTERIHKAPILLTGASGLLGNYVCRQLFSCKNFVPVANTHPVSGFALSRAVDLRNRDRSFALLNSIRPEIIIHAAAETNVEKCEANPIAAVGVNIDITNHLVEWVEQFSRDTLLVYISTDQLYDGPGPHHEDNVYPRNVYALTKFAAEAVTRRCPHHLILRANFVGWSSRGTGFGNWLVDRLTRHEPLTLVDDVKFNPLAANDLVNLILQLISQQVRGIYNVGAAGPGWTKAEFGLKLGGELGLDLSSVRIGKMSEMGLRAMRPNDMTMNVDAIEAVLGGSLPKIEDTVTQLVSERKAMGLSMV